MSFDEPSTSNVPARAMSPSTRNYNLPISPSTTTNKSNRPIDNAFLQQRLPACMPLLTQEWVITIYMLVGIVFIPIGLLTLLASNSVVEIVDGYETTCLLSTLTDKQQKVDFIQSTTTNKLCRRILTVPKEMKQPIYVYYELDNFYQNHRRYVKSKSDAQLLYGNRTSHTQMCKPEQKLLNNDNLTIIPCGLIAWSLFNDTYIFTALNQQLAVNKTGISWKSDREHKYGNVLPQNFPNNLKGNGVLIGGAGLNLEKPLNEDEDLLVWMRIAAFPTFRKLYGKIQQDLDANTIITVEINNVYNTYSFDGKKKLVLSTSSWLGGNNDFLGIVYTTVGSLSIFLALLHFMIHISCQRRPGDLKYLTFKEEQPLVMGEGCHHKL